jgi:hypothetical protein
VFDKDQAARHDKKALGVPGNRHPNVKRSASSRWMRAFSSLMRANSTALGGALLIAYFL